MARLDITTSGVWSFSFQIQFVSLGVSRLQPGFQITNVGGYNSQISSLLGQNNYYSTCGSYVYYVPSGNYSTVYLDYSASSAFDAYGVFKAVRIA
jgi:hypothetical protein